MSSQPRRRQELVVRATPLCGRIRNQGSITSAAIEAMPPQRLGPTCAKRTPRLLAFAQQKTKNIRKAVITTGSERSWHPTTADFHGRIRPSSDARALACEGPKSAPFCRSGSCTRVPRAVPIPKGEPFSVTNQHLALWKDDSFRHRCGQSRGVRVSPSESALAGALGAKFRADLAAVTSPTNKDLASTARTQKCANDVVTEDRRRVRRAYSRPCRRPCSNLGRGCFD